MTKKEAYQHLLNQVNKDNGMFSVRASDKKGRCRAITGSPRDRIDRAKFLKQVQLFRNIANSVENTEKIDIEIPNFLPRPQPIVIGKYPIKSKYNKTCKCTITVYHAGCTYWSSWNNQYWITKGIQLKQYSNMIDTKFANSISMIKKQKIEENIPIIVSGVSILPLIVVGLLLYTSRDKN